MFHFHFDTFNMFHSKALSQEGKRGTHDTMIIWAFIGFKWTITDECKFTVIYLTRIEEVIKQKVNLWVNGSCFTDTLQVMLKTGLNII